MHEAIIIRHIAFEDLGTFEEVLVNAGYNITYVDAGVDDLEQVRQSSPELLIILGGPISVYDQEIYPFLSKEIEILKERVKKNLPTIGICLGAQLLAEALGGKVFSGDQKEIGWSKISLTDHGRKNCFRHLGENGGTVFHWHGDTFTLPEHTNLQASTEKYENQAFTVGNNILAIQFHPEVDGKKLEKWFIGHACEIGSNNVNLNELRDDTKKYSENLKKQSRLFFSEWISNLDKNYITHKIV